MSPHSPLRLLAGFAGMCMIMGIAGMILLQDIHPGTSSLSLAIKSQAADVRTYYVDCSAGNDTSTGLSETQAWQTVGKVSASQGQLLAGDRIAFKTGCIWSGEELRISTSGTAAAPITYTSYGIGAAPTIVNPAPDKTNDAIVSTHNGIILQANHIIIEKLHLDQIGKFAIQVLGDANVMRGLEISRSGLGVTFGSFSQSANHNRLTQSTIHHCVIALNSPKSQNADDDYGANGVNLWAGSHNEIDHNRIEECHDVSYDYGEDGGVFEIYATGQVSHNHFHHNFSRNNRGFLEIGGNKGNGGTVDNNIFAYNLSINDGNQGTTMWFHQDTGYQYGVPIHTTRIYNNTFVQAGGFSIGMNGKTSFAGDLDIRNTIVAATSITIGTGGGPWTHTHNVYTTSPSHALNLGEKVIGDLFTDASSDWSLKQSAVSSISAPRLDFAYDGYSFVIHDTTYNGISVAQNQTVTAGACGQVNPSVPCTTDAVSGDVIDTYTPTPPRQVTQTPTPPSGSLTPSPTPTRAFVLSTLTPTGYAAAPSGTPSVTPRPIIIDLRTRLQGVTRSTTDTPILIQVTFKSSALPTPYVTRVPFTHEGDGVYRGELKLLKGEIVPARDYIAIFKGPKHIARRMCTSGNQSDGCDGLARGKIEITSGDNRINTSKTMLWVGDLPIDGHQDGVMDSFDLSYLVSHLSHDEPAILAVADVNDDGIVDTRDYILLISNQESNIDQE